MRSHIETVSSAVATAMKAAEQALLGGDEERLYEALKAMGVHKLQSHNKGWYLKELQADRESKEQVGADDPPPSCQALSLAEGFLLSGVSRRGAD